MTFEETFAEAMLRFEKEWPETEAKLKKLGEQGRLPKFLRVQVTDANGKGLFVDIGIEPILSPDGKYQTCRSTGIICQGQMSGRIQ